MKKVAVIVAGGQGTRMRAGIPKQFLTLKNKPVLYYTIRAFLEAFPDMTVILVLPVDHMDKGKELIDGFFDTDRVRLCSGGETRFHSVRNGLALVSGESIIFVHDGVRCLLTADLVRRCYHVALETGNAVPVTDCSDTVRYISSRGSKTLNRNRIKFVQTPQTFHSRILLPAYGIDYKKRFTDEATVVEAFGIKVNLIEGEKNNIKITRPSDLALAEALLLE